jgi:methylated-DNA-protein-cysteine methyltransferase related protein
VGRYEAFYEIVRLVPPGRVTTYGRVAALAGFPGRARQVGYALAALPDDSDTPWHRIVNAEGRVSKRAGSPVSERIQRAALEAEGVVFDDSGRLDLKAHRWEPPIATDRQR